MDYGKSDYQETLKRSALSVTHTQQYHSISNTITTRNGEVKMYTLDTRAYAKSKLLSPNERNQERIIGVRELTKTRLQQIRKGIRTTPRHTTNNCKCSTQNLPLSQLEGITENTPSTFNYVYSTTYNKINSSSPLFQPHEPPHPFKFLRTGGYTKQTECPSCTQNQLPF